MWQEIKNIYHLGCAVIDNLIYGFPARKITVVGVTGTDGKTTTASLIYHVLKQSGKKVAMITTVGAWIDDEFVDTGLHATTPSSALLQKLIRRIVARGCTYLVLEVTSHGLDQNRVFGIPFAIGVLTNITPEHLDYHKTYENYVQAKAKLLLNANVAIVNRDDKSYEFISKIKNQKSKIQSKNKRWITYGLNEHADVNPQAFPFTTKLMGTFNRYNCLAAIATANVLGIDWGDIQKAIASFTPPKGRQDIVYNKNFTVMIDFAHTPNAFAGLLSQLRKQTKGRLIHVFGAAGQRDARKRPEMGKMSSAYADIIVLTAEDPRRESVEKIMEEIAQGVQSSEQITKKQKNLFQIPDRKKAIMFAVSIAQKGDCVVVTGKGHEQSMNYGKGEVPWDEKAAILEALKTNHDA